jgi:membrane protein implicated in regulation of membrane protease activity
MNRDIIESLIDIGSGFILAIVIQLTIFPYYNISVSIFENFQIALIFLLVSLTRSALWRRFFRKRKEFTKP